MLIHDVSLDQIMADFRWNPEAVRPWIEHDMYCDDAKNDREISQEESTGWDSEDDSILYTEDMITSVVVLCIWCVAANPGDPGIFKSAEHPKLNKDGRRSQKNSDHGLSQGGKMSSFHGLYTLDQLVMQWLSGALVLILCIVERGEFSRQIVYKLGSTFSTVVFIIVVGISTYDYIIALREQDEDQQEEIAGHQSP
uniref:Uncharacterized protein n=1 Tax=Oryza meridionalis TaxID=40149 RepID=A0A0E0EX72_9ORYZ